MFERFYLIFSKANPFRHTETKCRKFSISQRLEKSFTCFLCSSSLLFLSFLVHRFPSYIGIAFYLCDLNLRILSLIIANSQTWSLQIFLSLILFSSSRITNAYILDPLILPCLLNSFTLFPFSLPAAFRVISVIQCLSTSFSLHLFLSFFWLHLEALLFSHV